MNFLKTQTGQKCAPPKSTNTDGRKKNLFKSGKDQLTLKMYEGQPDTQSRHHSVEITDQSKFIMDYTNALLTF